MTDLDLDTLLLTAEPSRAALPSAWPRARAAHLVDLAGEVGATLFGLGFGAWIVLHGAPTAVLVFAIFVATFVSTSAAASYSLRASRARHEPDDARAFLHASRRNLDLALAHNTFTRVGNVLGGLAALALFVYVYATAATLGGATHAATAVAAAILIGCVVHTERSRQGILAQRERVDAWITEYDEA